MKRKGSIVPIFLLFLLLSLILFFFSQKGFFPGVNGFFEIITVPVQRVTFALFHLGNGQSAEQKLREENANLLMQLAREKEIEKENRALHDQFQITSPSPKQLLPVQVIGRGNDEIIIDKGSNQNVKVGEVIIVKDNLVGIVVRVSAYRAVVTTVTSAKTSLTAQAVKTGALGVVNGTGTDEIIFNNVVQADKLEKDDIVTTRGDVDAQGRGYPPDLLIGKIISVNKRASSLFQQADVKSLVDFTNLTTVFVMLN